jgi:hypothetical protein
MKMNWKATVLVIVCGVAITLLTALYSADMTVGLGASITGYGLPLLWLKKEVIVVPGAPEEFSLNESGLYLLADLVFWIIIVAIVYIIYKQVTKK